MGAKIQVKVSIIEDDNWKLSSACKNLDTSMFFEEFEKGDSATRRKVIAICNTCEVKDKCLQYAKEMRCSGVFGGEYFWCGRKLKNPLGFRDKSGELLDEIPA